MNEHSSDDELEEEGWAIGSSHGLISDLKEAMEIAEASDAHFVVCSLFHPRLRRNPDPSKISSPRFSRSDMVLDRHDWVSNVIGTVSSWISCDCASDLVRKNSEAALRQEYSYSVHLGLQAIILPRLSSNCPNFARILSSLLTPVTSTTVGAPYSTMQLWVKVSLSNSRNQPLQEQSPSREGWEIWDRFRHTMGHEKRLCVVLDLSAMEKEDFDSKAMCRWLGEPVSAIILPVQAFFKSKQEKPILRQCYKSILIHFLKLPIHLIISGKSEFGQRSDFKAYVRQVEKWWKSNRKPPTLFDSFSKPFRDSLRSPLQPLVDDLESETYTVMEQDPVKYAQYELAIQRALEDFRGEGEEDGGGGEGISSKCLRLQPKSKKARKITLARSGGGGGSVSGALERGEGRQNLTKRAVVVVVGPGRGPLIKAALSAAHVVGVPTVIYAIEKNPNAVITLKNRARTDNWTNVEIIQSDVRDWKPLELADIMVSELLGSWGDNELSPEVLDQAKKCLKQSGVCIPASYTSFISPVVSSKLWNAARDMDPLTTHERPSIGRGLETPYVVHLHNCRVLNAAQPIFSFVHPGEGAFADNSRFATVSFEVEETVTIHGFAGFFDSVLYKDVGFSTVPETHSPGMFSWFPMFIPLAAPVRLVAHSRLVAHFWRCVGPTKVWYEWMVSEPQAASVQNPNGRSFWVGL